MELLLSDCESAAGQPQSGADGKSAVPILDGAHGLSIEDLGAIGREVLGDVGILMKSKSAVTCCGQGTYIETEKENGL